MVVVRQRQYAIGVRGMPSQELVTENIWTCTAFCGVDERSGVVFLCHMDTPWCSRSLPALIDDLHWYVDDLSGFHLYMVGGVPPFLLFAFCAIGLALLAMGIWWVGLCAGVISLAFGMTRLALQYKLWRLKVFCGLPVSPERSRTWLGLGLCGMQVSASIGTMPKVYSYRRKHDYDRFKEPDSLVFKMVRAPESA